MIGADEVRQDLAEEDPDVPGAERAARLDELLLLAARACCPRTTRATYGHENSAITTITSVRPGLGRAR